MARATLLLGRRHQEMPGDAAEGADRIGRQVLVADDMDRRVRPRRPAADVLAPRPVTTRTWVGWCGRRSPASPSRRVVDGQPLKAANEITVGGLRTM
jgi:hypothetical protein